MSLSARPWVRWGLALLGLVCGCGGAGNFGSRDLLQELASASSVEEGSVLDVGEEAARPALGRGWSYDESVPQEAAFAGDTTFAWSVEELSELQFQVIEPADRRVYLGLRPFLPAGAPPLGLSLAINGHRLQSLSLTGDRVVSLDVPGQALRPGMNLLTLEPSRSPVAATVDPGSQDPRRLAVAVFFALFSRSNEPFPGLALAWKAQPPKGSALLQGSRRAQAPFSKAWDLRIRDGARLQYQLRKLTPGEATVLIQWITEDGVETLARHELSDSWLGSDKAAGRLDAPSGRGILKLQAMTQDPRQVLLELGSLSLEFPAPPRPWNVLWITLDTFRADHLGSYGNPEIRTPNLDRLARESMIFSGLRSQVPITGPAHSSLFTGRYPVAHGVRNNGEPLPLSEETAAEYLKAYGWDTAGIISLVVLHSAVQFAQGFDRYFDCPGIPWWRTGPEVTPLALEELDRARSGKPFFLWVHYSDTHEPYGPPGTPSSALLLSLNGQALPETSSAGDRLLEHRVRLRPGVNELRLDARALPGQPFQGAMVRYLGFDTPLASLRYADGFVGPNSNHCYTMTGPALVHVDYAGAVEAEATLRFWAVEQTSDQETLRRYRMEAELMDAEIGRLLGRLRENGLEENTLILVNSDHGEGLWDHLQPGHVAQLYEEAMHSPGILRLPGPPRPVLVPILAQHVDLLPTLLDLLGLPPKSDVQGRSLAPAISDRHFQGGRAFLQTFAPEAPEDQFSLLEGSLKLIWGPSSGRIQLFDLARDGGERQDLAETRPDAVQTLLRELQRLEQEARSPRPSQQLAPSALDLEQLHSLGYAH